MKVLLLCGGVGKRMFPISEDKFLIRFMGKSLLEHQLDTMKQAGLNDFVFIGNPGNIDRLMSVVKQVPDVHSNFVVQEKPCGIGNAIVSAEKYLDGPFLLQSSNDLVDVEAYLQILGAVKKGTASSYILAHRVTRYFPGGYLVFDKQNNLKRIIEKPLPGSEPSDLVNVMVHIHNEPSLLLDYIKRTESAHDDIYEMSVDRLVGDGQRVTIVPYDGPWVTVKYPWHLLDVMQTLLLQSPPAISPSARISDRALIDGSVTICDNVSVMENAIIRGPAYIGANTVIGNNTLVRGGCHLGDNCVVGFGSEIKGSYIGDNCLFHMNYVGDSVVDNDCLLGAGTITANLRFDGRNVVVNSANGRIDSGTDKLGAIIGARTRTGVNVSLMPGVRIAPGSVIEPNACLRRDYQCVG